MLNDLNKLMPLTVGLPLLTLIAACGVNERSERVRGGPLEGVWAIGAYASCSYNRPIIRIASSEWYLITPSGKRIEGGGFPASAQWIGSDSFEIQLRNVNAASHEHSSGGGQIVYRDFGEKIEALGIMVNNRLVEPSLLGYDLESFPLMRMIYCAR